MFDVIRWDGQKISKPGLYSGIPNDAYHGDICVGPSFSSSGLRTIFHESPEDFFTTSYLNPEWMAKKADSDKDDKPHLILGSAVHHLLLGQELFENHYVQQPKTYYDPKSGLHKKWTGQAHICQAWDAEQHAAGKMILDQAEMEQILGMAKSLGRNELVRAGCLRGLTEHSMFWIDRKTGLWLKSRPDVIPTSSGEVTDLKTTTDVREHKLRYTIEEFAYEQQAALTAEAMQTVLGVTMTLFTFLFVKKTAPFSCCPIWLKDVDLVTGFEMNRAALDIAATCLKENHWYGPGGKDNLGSHLELSKFRRERIKNRLELMGYDVQKEDTQ